MEQMGWRSHRLGLWPLLLKLGLNLSNRCRTNGTHDGEMSRLGIGSKKMADDPCDSKRKDKFITSHHISINIHEREHEMRGKVYRKALNEGKQKASTRLGNGVIVRQRIKNKCHHHVKESQTFCKAQS